MRLEPHYSTAGELKFNLAVDCFIPIRTDRHFVLYIKTKPVSIKKCEISRFFSSFLSFFHISTAISQILPSVLHKIHKILWFLRFPVFVLYIRICICFFPRFLIYLYRNFPVQKLCKTICYFATSFVFAKFYPQKDLNFYRKGRLLCNLLVIFGP